MISPADLSLPFPSWTTGQFDLIAEARLAETKFVLIEAPTGTGKSAVAMAAARLGEAKVHVITGTKQLQDQYVRLGPMKVMGRNNFDCIIEDVTADQAPCTAGYKCDEAKGNPPACPYYLQRWRGMRAKEVAFNYAYWLAAMNYVGWSRPDMVVCDEAHQLEDEVRRFATISVRRTHVSRLADLGLYWPGVTDFDGWQLWAQGARPKVADEHRDYERNKEWLDSVERKRYAAVEAVWQVTSLLTRPDVDSDSWVLQEQPWGMEFLPVWVSGLTEGFVWRHAPKFVLMTATVLDPTMFAAQLGIPAEQVTFIRAPSTFDKGLRPLHYEPVGRVKANDPASLRMLTREIDRIAERHVGQNGLIHTGSYKIAQFVLANSRWKGRMIGHDTRGRVAALDRFKDTSGAILVSPSVGTGVDLPYDLCRWQVIAKLPFPDQGDPQVKKRMKEVAPGVPNPKGQNWYNWITACNVVQAYGRGMRAEDDSCVTYLLDGNWQWFRHAVGGMLPGWFKEAIVNPKVAASSYDDILAQIRGTK